MACFSFFSRPFHFRALPLTSSPRATGTTSRATDQFGIESNRRNQQLKKKKSNRDNSLVSVPTIGIPSRPAPSKNTRVTRFHESPIPNMGILNEIVKNIAPILYMLPSPSSCTS
jgi:hypothetical protein